MQGCGGWDQHWHFVRTPSCHVKNGGEEAEGSLLQEVGGKDGRDGDGGE